jgi:sigma-E factor negative regulatory protein RseA
MDTKKMSLEELSAFADGEAVDSHSDAVIALLRQPEGKTAWDIYHSIGDALRSDDLAFAMRPDFAARVAARLEAEPAIVAPQLNPESEPERLRGRHAGRMVRRYAIPGAAAAAVAVALISAPQWMAGLKGQDADPATAITASVPSAALRVASVESGGAIQSQVVAVRAQNGVILRDPRIDDYLLAHQRFSPSIYSTAQYARSATFSSDSNK